MAERRITKRPDASVISLWMWTWCEIMSSAYHDVQARTEWNLGKIFPK
jgi:hypothetical protein